MNWAQTHLTRFLLLISWGFTSTAELADHGKVDFAMMEFEDLETEKNKDAFVKNLRRYEVIYPQALEKNYKLSEKHRRLRRDLNDDRVSHYQINAFGKILQLELYASSSVLPGATVEYHTEAGIQKKLLSQNSCLRIGKVSNVNMSSAAAISDCDGLAGLVRTDDDMFFIEPMKTNVSFGKSRQRPHLVYRTKDLPRSALPDVEKRMSLDTPLKAGNVPRIGSPLNRPSRTRRDVWDSFITIINKARRSVQLYWLDLYGKRRYFATIEQNRRKFVSTYSQTKWVAVDESSQEALLMNGKKQYVSKRNDESNRDKVVITVPPDLELPPITEKDVSGEDKWMETLIVADESVVQFHGKSKVEKYLLILSNVINLIMKDSTTGVRLNFVLTRLVILQKREPRLVITRDSASMSVQSACDYAVYLQSSHDDKHVNHHDFALVLTRRDFGPAGYAPVYTMCSQTRSCALVDDNGFASAFIAAHEAGHVLGLGHDGEENDCKQDTKKGSVMAALVLSKLNRFHWSSCSRKLLQENTRYFRCLEDRPYPKDFKYMDSLPGVFATMDEQCRYDFGKGYEKCEYYTADGCQRLWCTESSRRYQSCTTRGRPPLDGTYCGQDKWCRRGRCVQSSQRPADPPPVNGNWGSWAEWSKCSLSCGTGLRHRTRVCDNPKPTNRGEKCPGSSIEHAICNTQRCRITKTFEDIRDDQCKQMYGEDFILYRDEEFAEYFKDQRYSLDCTFENGWCNWRQDENDKFDWNRISGRTPSQYTGPRNDPHGNVKGKYAFIEASDNFNARRQRGFKARLVSPRILLPRACFSLDYHMYGEDMGSLKIIVKGENGETTLWEKIGNQGDHWHELELSIEQVSEYSLVIEGVRGTHYKGDAAIDNIKFEPGLCQAGAEAKNPCKLPCMSNDKTRFFLDNTVLDGTHCHNNKSYDICLVGKCEKFGCDMKFNSDKILDECNVCGGDGSTCNAIEGIKKIIPDKDYEKILDLDKDTTNFILEDSKLSPYKIGLRVPGSIDEVYMAAEKGRGYFAAAGTTLYFSNLKDGRQMMAASGPLTGPLEAVLYSGSNEVKPVKEEAEIRFKYFYKKNVLDFYKYEVDKWEECSKKCGGGIQKGILKCVKNKVSDVPRTFCSHLKMNDITRVCNTVSCHSVYKWVILSWSRCSATCGVGRQRRIVACADRKLNKVVPNRDCPAPYPISTRNCTSRPCITYRWTLGPWGTCSRSCGGGLQTRVVNCVASNNNEAVSSSFCKEKEPGKIQKCNLNQCDSFEYRTTAVSRCTKSCGGGLRVKIVYCINKRTGVSVSNSFCSGPSPPRIEKCNVQDCPVFQWKYGTFGPCSQSCDGGIRQRPVYCIEKVSLKNVTDSLCTDRKPSETETCENPPCSQYFFDIGKWSACDAICGQGSQNRTVRCLMEGSDREAPSWRCDHLKMPDRTRSCKIRSCAHPDSLACNFDDGSFCRWQNSKDDDFDWVIGRSTPTLTTGPSRDHTTQKGRFAYIESSSPRLSRDRATLTSPPLRISSGCFSFWYHMRGAGMGRLFVVIVGAQGYSKQIFEKQRQQGDRWFKANIQVPRNSPKGFMIKITGEKGSSFLSDIGLDDFKFSSEGCQASCIERSPLCVVVPTTYCRYPSYRKLCCVTCAKRAPS